MVRRTEKGFEITISTIKTGAVLLSFAGATTTGIVAAVHFIDRAKDTVPRAEFVEHVRSDSNFHAKQEVHTAFLDSSVARANRDNHELVCFVNRNPQPFCKDETVLAPARGRP